MTANRSTRDHVAEQLNSVCVSEHSDNFAGIAVDENQNRIVIFAREPAALQRVLEPHLQDTRVEFRAARYSRQHLQEVRSRLSSDSEYWLEQGVRFEALTIKHDGSCVEVTSRARGAGQRLSEYYGLEEITVVSGRVDALPYYPATEL